jgi:hypothetical protein
MKIENLPACFVPQLALLEAHFAASMNKVDCSEAATGE